jgi:toxin ParE1/3/4
MQIFWEEDAEADLDRIFEYILEDNPEAAMRIVDTIRQAVQMLIEHPHLGRPGRVADTRELVIPGIPYIVDKESVSQYREILGNKTLFFLILSLLCGYGLSSRSHRSHERSHSRLLQANGN